MMLTNINFMSSTAYNNNRAPLPAPSYLRPAQYTATSHATSITGSVNPRSLANVGASIMNNNQPRRMDTMSDFGGGFLASSSSV